eukprot:evm.model.scf_1646.2 EVM.evm.TU.scf_1646.2   scf_1646:9021-11405(-)
MRELEESRGLTQRTPPAHGSGYEVEPEESGISFLGRREARLGEGHDYESLDYVFDENGAFLDAPDQFAPRLLRLGLKWTLCLLVGAITAILAFSVNFSVENLAGAKFWLVLRWMQNGATFWSYVAYLFINCSLVAFSSAVVVYYGPAAAGSGIPDVKAFLNGVEVPEVLEPHTLVAKVVGSVGAVAGSLAVGKEGPFVHTGACLAYLLTQGQKVHSWLKWKWLNVFRNDRQLRDFVTCGAAAGVAAAFRAPVGGVLFALEEATSWWRNQILWLAFFTTAVVSVVLRVLIRRCENQKSCGFFGSGGFIVFEVDEAQESYELFELLPMLLLGVLGGLLGSAFNALNARLTVWRQAWFKHSGPKAKIMEAVSVAFLTSTISFCVPLTVQCKKCPTLTGDQCPGVDDSYNYVKFNCGDGYYNDVATLFFNTQDDAIRSLFSSNNNDEYRNSSLLLYFVFFFFLSVLTYGVAIPSGLFVPCILCGASYGRLVGGFVIDWHPHHSIDEGTYALLGAAGFLGGATRMTVSLCVILLELTNNLALLPLVMLVLLVAKGVGDGSGVGAIYDIHVYLKGIPFLEPHPERFMKYMTAGQACSRPVVAFHRRERVATVLEALQSTKHSGFPVTVVGENGASRLLGLVRRSQLLRALGLSPSQGSASRQRAAKLSMLELTVPGRGHLSPPGDSSMDGSEDDELIDLGPLVEPHALAVPKDLPVSRAYELFRTLGLRHMLVVPPPSSVVGIITRDDLMPRKLEMYISDDHSPALDPLDVEGGGDSFGEGSRSERRRGGRMPVDSDKGD